MTVTMAAPAKVNLWLRVGEPGETGFHDLDTLFCALQLADTVAIRPMPPGTGLRLHVAAAPPLSGTPDLGPVPDNLAVRAAAAFFDRAGIPADLEIRIIKRIPTAGGLGGGSSDAAAVLRALARLHPDRTDADTLRDLAAGLGSDVPFFLEATPLARGLGRGTRLTPFSPLPTRPVLLVLPPFGVGTREAYRWLDDDRRAATVPPVHPLPDTPTTDPPGWDDAATLAGNDFEGPVFHRHPALRALRDALAGHGARPALLAGSGSTLFGVFEDGDRAEAAGQAIRGGDPAVRVVLTRTRSR